MMKKNFIYSLCILLCGAIFMSSCEDMLEVESDRVEYNLDDLTLNDTVYSVLGILKKVQAVVDRQVLLGELRGDLMVVNEKSAVTDIQKIARFEFEDENKYIDVKDYYAIINNCNIYLKRVEKNLNAERDGKKPLLKEFVGVKSIRAWAYMQLATNYGNVPYFTEPILTHSMAEEIMQRESLGMAELAQKLIEDIEPYANPNVYPMPNFPGMEVATELYFVPIRQLLGDLYLWTKQYRKAIKNYYNVIYDNRYVSNTDSVSWIDVKDGEVTLMSSSNYSPLYSITTKSTIAVATFSTNSDQGTVSELGDIIRPMGIVGSHMVAASPGIFGLSKKQVYFFSNRQKGDKLVQVENPSKEQPGDLRLYANTREAETNEEDGILYEGVISKWPMMIDAIKLGRPVQTYLRLAEAIVGLASSEEGWMVVKPDTTPAYVLAMDILKVGLKDRVYQLIKQTGTEEVEAKKVKIDEETGDTIKIEVDGVLVPDTLYYTVTVPVYEKDSMNFNEDEFIANTGVHTLGSGQSDLNAKYSIASTNDSCIADYFNKPIVGYKTVLDKDGNPVINEETGEEVTLPDYALTEEDRINYVRNLIIDECALELAFEGYRFTDLVRFAEAVGDVDVLAKRVAGRAFENSVNYYNPAYQYDATLYQKLIDKANWYLPLK